MAEFKTLLQKLKPEIRTFIESERAKYPNMVSGLLERLDKVFVVLDMTYGDAHTMMNYYTDAFGQKPIDPWECFQD
jgi:hypothetical protein